MLNYQNKQPYIEGVPLEDIEKVQQTPFYIYSQSKIIETYNNLKNALNTKVYFAVKANSNQAILKLMNSLGAGADVVSIGELKRALNAGINPSNIIFEGLGKSRNDILFALDSNIKLINAESMEELEIINEISSSLQKKVNVGVRLNPNIDSETIKKISTGKKTDKFGIDVEEIPTIVNYIESSSNLKLTGISCHIGSQISNISVFGNVFKFMKEAAEQFINKGIHINHVDLGGGLGVQYNENDLTLNLALLKKEINKYFNQIPYEISFEPGRYLVANAGILITSIITTKKNGGRNYLITDAGMNTLIRPALYNAFHSIEPIEKKSSKIIDYSIAGPICESSDIFIKSINLPEQKTGNKLIIKDVGAYGAVMASNYNTRGLPAEILVNQNSFAIIHKPQTIEENINLDLIPNWLN
ncbi:MAG: Diaminopimelate decarboxylase [Alphaproteobacteria bacterium MarineAlpha5_Bin5]|nr:MAG: Diaminopimelate decarboxylase [Alphaproteobacteria bacterium MarineAlpha5_Bin5]PPR52821.1 MAG: Diaminopimelate decarboxylase [Alphaproteobacteria bacterium MarineAlpha5_Bin4]|tara:strand:+ start:3616 stop:4860 length:1245 start_codon:yes stop_codon:yes gene_type:complete